MEFHKSRDKKLIAVISENYKFLFTRQPNYPDLKSVEYSGFTANVKDLCLEQIMINNPHYHEVYEGDEIIIKI